MTEVKRLLAEATPLPWAIDDTSDHTADLVEVGNYDGAPPKTAWFRGDVGNVDVGDYRTLSLADGKLIEHAVNHLPDYLAAVEALERLLDWREFYTDADWRKARSLPAGNPWDAARAALARLRDEVPA